MKITLRDCLRLPRFQDAQVCAGERYLAEYSLKKVSVLETYSATDMRFYENREGQLMLGSFFGVADDLQAQKQAIQDLQGTGCVGLALFHVGKVLPYVHEEVKMLAEELHFPLLIMGENAGSIGDCINDVMEMIFFGPEAGAGSSLIYNTVSRVLNFEKYTSFPEAMKAAALANDFQVVLLSRDYNPLFSVETRHRTTIAEAIRLGREQKITSHIPVFTRVDVENVVTYWGPVYIQEEEFYLFLVDNEDAYTLDEMTRLAEIIQLAIGMWGYTPERDVKGDFVRALRRGNESLAYGLKGEMDLEPKDILSVFFITESEEGTAKKIAKEMGEEAGLQTIFCGEDGETYGIVVRDGDLQEARANCLQFYERFRGDGRIRIYHVTGIDGIEGACSAYRLIGDTMSFAPCVFPTKAVFSRYELAMINDCIAIRIAGGGVQQNYQSFFDPFQELGENKRMQLMTTLETYVLDASMSSARTAAQMDIHANTVQYRLRRIDEMMGTDITGHRIIPGLTMALALRRLERMNTTRKRKK